MSASAGSGPEWPERARPWAEAIAEILTSGLSRVLVLGATDVGKSAFCRDLLAAAARSERSYGLLDCDPGQKLVGPPAAVTYAQARQPDVLTAMGFLGSTNPLHCRCRIAPAIGTILARVAPRHLVVNTDGLLTGAGLHLKAQKIAMLRPDLLVAIGQDAGLEALLRAHPDLPLLRVPSPLVARRKSTKRRRLLRREAFRRYFDAAGRVVLPAEITLKPLPEGQLLGLRDGNGIDRALGIVTQVRHGTMEVLTPMSPQCPASVLASRLCLDQEFGEHPAPSVV